MIGDYLATGFYPLDKAEGNKQPGRSQASHVLPPDDKGLGRKKTCWTDDLI